MPRLTRYSGSNWAPAGPAPGQVARVGAAGTAGPVARAAVGLPLQAVRQPAVAPARPVAPALAGTAGPVAHAVAEPARPVAHAAAEPVRPVAPAAAEPARWEARAAAGLPPRAARQPAVALPRVAPGEPAVRRRAPRRRRGARRRQAEPPQETAREAAAEPRARRAPPRIPGAVVMSSGSTAGPLAGVPCWHSVPWSPKSFGALSAAAIGRRDSAGCRRASQRSKLGCLSRAPWVRVTQCADSSVKIGTSHS
jgi:hypothetical protein